MPGKGSPAQAVLDTEALHIAHQAKSDTARLSTALEMHLTQCAEREGNSQKSRAAIHKKIDALGEKMDRDYRAISLRFLTVAGIAILQLLGVIGALIAWLAKTTPAAS